MKKSRKILTGILVAAMLVSSLGGCSNSAESSSSESTVNNTSSDNSSSASSAEWEYQEDTSPYEFTVWWPSVWMGKDSIEAGYEDSDVCQYIKEQTGVTMYVDCPAGDENELASVMIAAGTFPEAVVFSTYNSVYLQQMIDAGQVLAFSDLMDQYCPKMWELIPDSVKAYHTSDDGKMWAFTGFTYDSSWGDRAKELGASYVELAPGTNVMYIRQDLLTAYGKDDITDLDEYTEFLHWVKDNYPDLDPVQSVSGNPRGGSLFSHFKSTFGCHLSDTYPQEDGSVKYYMYDPHYVDYLKWMNGLYRDGIITKNMLTENQSSIDTKTYSASYGSMINAIWNVEGTLGQSIKSAYGEDTDKIYVDCGPIQKEGIEWKVQMTVDKGGQTTAITTNAEKPDRIIKYFEFLFTEQGQLTMMAGVEGKTWNREEDGTISYSQEIMDARNTSFEELTNTYKVVGLWSPWLTLGGTWEGVLGGMAGSSEDTEALAEKTDKRLNDWLVNIWDQGFSNIYECIETGSDLDVLRTKIDEVCNQAGMEMITAEDDATFEKLYQDCLAEIEGMGISQIEDAYTAEHKAQCEALGIS